ncbi:hypothetical protein J2S30_000514 [Herbaspirillum rubrisubalbicans]|nr:hypothetical protein [Herbaspirillum rubrisubalbicans]
MRELYKSKAFVWTLLILFLLVWFWMLGARVLVPTDEGRYAEMAREMVATQDWITTRLNGIKYFEKPPLQTWMNAITFELFGLGEWQARLWTGLCGLLGIGLAAYTGSRVFNGRVGFYAALVLASSFFWAGMGHINTLDMGLSGMMTIALCALLMAQRDGVSREGQRNWMLLCWGRHGAGGTVQGLDRHRPAGRGTGALYTLCARLGDLEATAPGQGPAAVLCHLHPVVRGSVAAQPGIPAILLHPRAFPALHHQDP